MRQRRRADLVAPAAATALLLGVLHAQPRQLSLDDRLYAIAAAEDARAATPAQLQTLISATRDSSLEVQQAAVRALGRLERSRLVPTLLAFLEAPAASVRAEAANALAQAVTNAGTDPDQQVPRVAAVLTTALERENDASVRGALLQSLGRLPFRTAAERTRTEAQLVAALSGEPSAAQALGALTGLESLYRTWPRPAKPDSAALAAIDRTFTRFDGATDEAVRVRRMALTASNATGHLSTEVIERATKDPDDQVRRLWMIPPNLPVLTPSPSLDESLRDPSPIVRYEALRASQVHFHADCAVAQTATTDSSVSVALFAIDLLGQTCNERRQAALDLLEAAARSDDWRRAAHAIVALARQAPDRAASLLERHVTHSRFQARMYGARAAAALGDDDAVSKLAGDADDNVREAAIIELRKLRGHAADDVYIAALSRPDYQLVRTAAGALQGTDKQKAASDALVAAFTRITHQRRDTSRDTRLAILERLKEIGGAEYAAPIQACLTDFDPRIASECASMLAQWGARTGPFTAPAAPRPATPPAAEIAALRGARARITMAGGGTIVLALLTSEAPLSVARFARLARAGYYNGLTFHRVVPNFVIQGGSPGANEYVGDGPFMRDEVGNRSHRRGTVGVSTRGRDTGDAQIFVNLVDNPRLDHIYTVFAEIVQGMDLVDAVQEGDVMVKVEILR